MKVAIIGAGYVGLTTATCLARLGHSVACLDIDAERIDRLNRNDIPIYEPGLAGLVAGERAAGRLLFSKSIAREAARADCIFIAVGTPSSADGDIDLSYVEAAASTIAPVLKPGAIVIIKSTVIAGTARRIADLIADIRGNDDIAVASNPEFLREGSAIADFLEADRVVLGADDVRASALLLELYRPLRERGIPVVVTTTENAELIKYAANAFLALKIGFINDVADLCESIGGDIAAVAEGIGLDRRIGKAFLAPGPGFGGSCFPKDTRAFAAIGRRFGAPQHLIETLIDENEARKRAMAQRILAELERDGGHCVAILGTAFKADTDDIREAAALTVIPLLQEAGVTVRAHDPKAGPASARLLADVDWCDSPYEAARGADVTAILTEWQDYREIDLARLARAMNGRTIVDCRNLFSTDEVTGLSLRYVSIGRAPAPAAPARTALPPRPPRTGRNSRAKGTRIPIGTAAGNGRSVIDSEQGDFP
jgi:UDPglucose 6-dehydrogenase